MRNLFSRQSGVPQDCSPHEQAFVRGVEISCLRPGIAQTLILLLSFALILPTLSRAQSALSKRPMTFDDMMQMKRLGETAVSPDGKWLAYSVTTVNLIANTKTPELWLQAIASPSADNSAPFKLAVGQPGDSDPQFAPDGKQIFFISSRDGAPQIWLADFDSATGADESPAQAH